MDKIILEDGTIFSILKYDAECQIALLKNDNSTFYNVVQEIREEKNGWKYSYGYTEDFEKAKEMYIEETNKIIDYRKYIK